MLKWLMALVRGAFQRKVKEEKIYLPSHLFRINKVSSDRFQIIMNGKLFAEAKSLPEAVQIFEANIGNFRRDEHEFHQRKMRKFPFVNR